MSGKSNIEWTNASWNPVVGCEIVSPGCAHCYAMKMAARIEACGTVPHYAGLTEPSKNGPVWNGQVRLAPLKTFFQPLRWSKPRMMFVNSMGDLFHEHIDETALDLLFAIMTLGWKHTFQILTKRQARMRAYMADPKTPERVWKIVRDIAPEWPDQFCDWMGVNRELQKSHGRLIGAALENMPPPTTLAKTILPWPLPNVWLGVSTERQQEANERIPELLLTPAVVRFISAEPLLGPIDLTHLLPAKNVATNILYYDALAGQAQSFYPDMELAKLPGLNWVIVGGESGPNFRPMKEAWARSIREQCQAAGVPFFMKQMAGKGPIPPDLLIRQFPGEKAVEAA